MSWDSLRARIATLLDSESLLYSTVTLVIAVFSCVGTWIAPQIVSATFERLSTSPLPSSAAELIGQAQPIQTVIAVGWVILTLIGSISLWVIAVASIRIVGNVFEFDLWRDFLPQKDLPRFLIVISSIYLLVAVYIRLVKFLPLSSAVTVIGAQASGMVLLGGFALVLVFIGGWFMDTLIAGGMERMSKEVPEELARLGDEPALYRQELHHNVIRWSLKYLVIGMALGATAGGIIAIMSG